MPVGTATTLLIFEAALKGLVGGIASYSTQALIRRLEDSYNEAKTTTGEDQNPFELSDAQRQTFLDRISQTEGVRQQVAAALSWDKNIMIVGPTGAGKTQLLHSLSGEKTHSSMGYKSTDSTGENEYKRTRYSSRLARFVDTPGSENHTQAHGTAVSGVAQSFFDRKPEILIVVLANGFLQSAAQIRLADGDKFVRRSFLLGSTAVEYDTIDDYLSATRREEVLWLRKFIDHLGSPQTKRHRAKHIIFAVNKMDLWFDEMERMQMERIYRTRHANTDEQHVVFESCINELLTRIGTQDQPYDSYSFFPISCSYDSFLRNKSPSATMSRAESMMSVDLLRLFLAGLINPEN